jgi:glycosyltransferase involved in cell wall biosynthesis
LQRECGGFNSSALCRERNESDYCYDFAYCGSIAAKASVLNVSDGNLRQIRILHFVSSGGLPGAIQQSLFMPLMTKMPKQRVKMQVASLSPGFTPAAVLRQNGVPVHDVSLSKHRFSWGAFGELLNATRQFRPDVIQAWGHTAQLAALAVRARCNWKLKVVWSVGETAPLPKRAGLIDRQKLKLTTRYATKADRIVYTSEAAGSQHRRVGYPDKGHVVVPPGVDPTRFKPDFAARRKIREQLGLAADAFVIGMVAPFQPEYDHPTFIKGVGELIKTNPKISVLLAGHGVQKGNAPLMALVGGGTLGTRTQLLGEWTDIASFYNACDIACSSAHTDGARMTLVMAMLCGIPCVATGMGGQGEVVGQFGIAIEPNSPTAFVRGIKRVLEMPVDRRAFMAQGARKHALTNFVYVRSLQKYLQLYFDVVGREALASEAVPVPEIDAAIPAPPPDMYEDRKQHAQAANAVSIADLSDPDSIEARVASREDGKPEQVKSAEVDLMQVFESRQTQAADSGGSPMSERARGVAEELEDLLSPEDIQVAAPVSAPRVTPVSSTSPTPPPVVQAAAAVVVAAVVPHVVPQLEPAPTTVSAPTPAPVAAVEVTATQPELSLLTDSQVQRQISLPLHALVEATPDNGGMQLELLPEPAEERKIAVGESL